MIILQYTLFSTTGKYKPVSTLVNVESVKYYNENKREVKQKAVTKICVKRCWTKEDLIKYGYTVSKIRLYTKEGEKKWNKGL